MSLGPLQIMIVNFEHTNFTGGIEAELVRLERNGILRVLDLAFVAKSDEGEITAIRTSDVHTGALTSALLGMDTGEAEADAASEDGADVWSAADAIAPGSAAAVVVLEHRWAIPLREAIAGAGGTNVVTEWADEAEIASLGVALPTG